MEHFYVTLPSDSSVYYFPNNTIANFTTKLVTPIQLRPDQWEVGLVVISYPGVCKKRLLLNTLRLGSEEISFPVKHYESVHDLLANMPYFREPYKKDKFISTFNEYINKYETYNNLINSCMGENSLRIRDNVVSHFPNRVYNGLEDLAETIMNHANCHSNKVTVPMRYNYNFALPEPVYVYADVVKPNLIGDSYVKFLTTLDFPSSTGYHRFSHPLYTPIEQSFIESIAIRLVTKNDDDVMFNGSDIPSVVTLHFKKKFSQ
jgi:hypothetical protein